MSLKVPVFRRSVASRGRRIYRRKIQRIVDPAETGRFVVIDVKSGDYEVADRDADATFRLMARRPDAVTWAERVGYAAAYRLGAGLRAK